MSKKPQFSITGQPVYPHIKLTNEDFPRPLATRVLEDDGDEYFGAFLNRTSVRILIDFLNRTFRLRSCTIDIDGSFDVPCTQFYAKRCVAPCVASLCDRESYLEIVNLERLFLRNDRELFLAAISKKIENAAEALDFEVAAFFHDMLQNVEKFWSNGRWQIWLDDAVDTYEVEEADEDSIVVIVVTQRGRRTLGELVFAFPKQDETSDSNAVKHLIEQVYRHYNPREIRVPYDFAGRKALSAELRTKIVVTSPLKPRVTAERAVEIAKARLRLARAKSAPTVDDILTDLQKRFGLAKKPKRIEAFDVAHISATGFAAAASVWLDGRYRPNEYQHWLSDQTSELQTLRAFLAERLTGKSPDLVLIDGGRSHLNAAKEAVASQPRKPLIVAVVKPPGKHSSISHFLTEDGSRVEFDQDVDAFRLIQRLRDDAHDLANATHRLSRDMMHFYELSAILPSLNERERQDLMRDSRSIKKIVEQDGDYFSKRFGEETAAAIGEDLRAFREGRSSDARPLIVPISYVEVDGQADDLIPIEKR
jgi:excinuclease ABC subunit C